MSNDNLVEIFYNFVEKPESFKSVIYKDSRGIPSIGVGYAFLKKDQSSGEWILSQDIDTFLNLMHLNSNDINFFKEQIRNCIRYVNIIENENKKGKNGRADLIINSMSEIENLITPLKDYIITENFFKEKIWNGNVSNNELNLYSEYTNGAKGAVTPAAWDNLSTKEKTAVFSVYYNMGNLTNRFSTSLQKYTSNRAIDGSLTVSNILGKIDAWYCIMYRMNPKNQDSKGIENRHIYEANEFLGKEGNTFSSTPDNNKSEFKINNLLEAKLLISHLYSKDKEYGTIKNQITEKLKEIDGYKNNVFKFMRYNYQSAVNKILESINKSNEFNIADLFEKWEIQTSIAIDMTAGWNITGTIREKSSITGSSLNDIIICEINDSLVSGNHNNTINADSGNDIIYAGSGNDTINAGTGNDTLIGGTGNDVLNGGTGADTYEFNINDGYDFIKETGNDVNTIKINASSSLFTVFSTSYGVIIHSASYDNHICIQGSENFQVKFSDRETTLTAMLQENDQVPADTEVCPPNQTPFYVPSTGKQFIYLPENFQGVLDLRNLSPGVEVFGIAEETCVLLPSSVRIETDATTGKIILKNQGQTVGTLTGCAGGSDNAGMFIIGTGFLCRLDATGQVQIKWIERLSELRQDVQFYLSQEKETAENKRSPLAIDLDGDGVETVSVANGVHFDHDGNGFAEKSGWISADDALLVRDVNEDGEINDGSELFGDQTVLSNGQKGR
ncbi:MAG: calcium-binding protein [Alphaproteobacteria bacterium]|nr:calcium-binding protein [Alphaproteobacteria bacterium]